VNEFVAVALELGRHVAVGRICDDAAVFLVGFAHQMGKVAVARRDAQGAWSLLKDALGSIQGHGQVHGLWARRIHLNGFNGAGFDDALPGGGCRARKIGVNAEGFELTAPSNVWSAAHAPAPTTRANPLLAK